LLKPLLAGLHAGGFEAVDERQQLPLESQQVRAGLAEASVLVRELAHGGELFGGGRDILGPALTAVGEDRTGMQFAVGAVAVGFSAPAAEGVERTGQERFAAEKDGQQFGELLLERVELGAEDTEFVGHGTVSGVKGCPFCRLLY
jgi:hypothetical protein